MTKNSTFSETDIFVVNGMTNIALNQQQPAWHSDWVLCINR